MKELFSSAYFGVILSVGAYALGLLLKKRFKWSVVNPLLIAIIIIIAVLLAFRIDYQSFDKGARYISYLLTPATVCLAIPLYLQLKLLKKNKKAILLGILAGVLSSLASIFALSVLFGLSHEEYVTLLPKSITTAIGLGVSRELGGFEAITVASIIVTGIFGSIIAPMICRLFKIKDPIAVGIAIGTSSHVIGTTKAFELGEVQGAMSSLSIVVAGLMTVVGASFFALLV